MKQFFANWGQQDPGGLSVDEKSNSECLKAEVARLKDQGELFESRINKLEALVAALCPSKADGETSKSAPSKDPTADCEVGAHESSHSSRQDSQTKDEENACERDSGRESMTIHDELTYPLQESVWDASIFLFHESVGRLGSLLLLGALGLAVWCQLFFCLVVHLHMTQNDFTTKHAMEGLHLWRLNAGHAAKNVDVVSLTSLTARVCADPMDMSLEMSTRQQEVVGDIRAYLAENSMVSGPNLCVLALLLFILHIMHDFSLTFWWVHGACSLSRRKGATEITEFEHSIIFRRISRSRAALVVGLGIARAVVTVCLTLVGVPFLVQTSNMQDLILNAMALTCILDFDDIVYKALAPRKCRRMVERCEPLQWRTQRTHFAGADVQVVFRSIVVVLSVWLVSAFMLKPFAEDLARVKEEVCKEPVDFVYAMNPKMGYLEWSFSMQSRGGSAETNGTNYREAAVREILSHGNNLPSATTSLAYQREINRVVSLHSMDPGSPRVSEENACMDMLDLYTGREQYFFKRVQAIVTSAVGHEVAVCADVHIDECDNLFTPEVRALCPVRCGCNNPRSGLFLSTPQYGCPAACSSALTYKRAISTLPCEDPSREELQQDPAWKRLWLGNTRYGQQRERNTGEQDLFLQEGCKVILFTPWASVWCAPTSSMLAATSLRAWCPLSCGCAGIVDGSCPTECRDVNSTSTDVSLEENNRLDCSIANLQTSEGECTIYLLGAPLFDMPEPLKLACCDAATDLLAEFVARQTFNARAVETLCCGGCVAKFFAVEATRMVLAGQGLTAENFCLTAVAAAA